MLPFQIEIQLIRKKFKIYGWANIISLVLVIVAVLVGIRMLINFIPDPYIIRSLILSSFIMLGGFRIHPTINSNNEVRMQTFFPTLKEKIRLYFTYKQLVIMNVVIIFFLMPSYLSIFEFKIFLFLFSIIQLLMLINTLCHKYLTLKYAESINAILRISYWILLAQTSIKVTGIDIWHHAQSLQVGLLLMVAIMIIGINVMVVKRYAYPSKSMTTLGAKESRI